MALSTDLGGIESEALPGPAQQVDVLGGLKGIGDDIVEGVTQVVVGNTSEKLNEKTDEMIANEAAQSEQPLDQPALEGTAEEIVVLSEVRRLRNMADQSPSSQRQRIELELRKIVSDAGDKHPGLKAQLRTELGRFVSIDPELAAVAQMDARNAASAAAGAKDIERMKDYAYNTLGLSPSEHPFGEAAFATEYVKREKHVQDKVTNDQLLAAQESQQNLGIDSYIQVYNKGMQGSASLIQAAYNDMSEGLSVVQKAMRDPTQGQNLEIMTMWENGGRQQALREVQQLRFNTAQRLNVIPPQFVDNPKYTAVKNAHDEQMEAIDTLIAAISTDDPTRVEVWKGYTTAKLIEFERTSPQFANQLRILNEMAPGMEAAGKAFDDAGAQIGHAVAGIMVTGLADLVGRDLGFSQPDGLPAAASVEDIQAQWNAVRTQNQDMYNTGMTTPTDIQASAVQDSVLKHKPEYLALALNDAVAPIAAAAVYSAEGLRANQYLTSGTFKSDGAKLMLEGWEDPANLDLAKKANQSSQPNIVEATIQQVAALAGRYEITRVRGLQTLMSQSVGMAEGGARLRLGEVLSIDASKLKSDGKISFVVDRDAVMKSTNIFAAVGTSQQEANYRKAVGKANELAKEVNKQLAWKANIQATWNQTFLPDYEAEWVTSFNDAIGEIEDGEAQ